MTNGSNNQFALEFDPNETVDRLFSRLGLDRQSVFLLAVDVDGRPFLAAAPGRKLQKVSDGTPSAPVSSIVHLEHASWVIYEQNPRRSRTRVGATTYDG